MTAAAGHCQLGHTAEEQEGEGAEEMPGLHSLRRDFEHKPAGRLNHGSFGATPVSVLQRQRHYQQRWAERPDEMFFRGELFADLRLASASCIPLITSSDKVLPQQVALIENACAATAMIAHRWSKLISPGDVVFVLDCVYGACRMCLQEHCCNDPRIGGQLYTLSIFEEHGSFPKSPAVIVERFRCSLQKQIRRIGQAVKDDRQTLEKHRPARSHCKLFFFLDYVSSQPAFVLPVAEMLRGIGVVLSTNLHAEQSEAPLSLGEICIDAAHAFAVEGLDVVRQFEGLPSELRPHWWFANLHKWAFAPPTATVVYAKTPELMFETSHPMISWFYGKGLREECLWAGTRDYSSLLSVPAAARFFQTWRSPDGLGPPAFSKARILEAGKYLSALWGTSDNLPDPELVCALMMVELPRELDVGAQDLPGLPTSDTRERRSVRTILRDDFNVEAAVGSFGPSGNFIRLSYAVYNTWDDILSLGYGVIQILQAQQSVSAKQQAAE